MQKIIISTDRILCKCATNVYPEGRGVMNDLIRYKITSKPLKVIANGNINGIDLDYFNPNKFNEPSKVIFREELNISSSDFVFIFIGRLVENKGINELITAFKDIKQTELSVKLLLVGPLEQDLAPLLSETLHEIETNKDIISVGFKEDVRPYLAISSALAFPSYREGFPNVVMQAGAMGLPSIVTDINGCNEIIIEGENGIIIPPKNEEALHKAMLFFLENPEKIKEMAQKSRPLIENRYEQKKVWEALLTEYKKLEEKHLKKN